MIRADALNSHVYPVRTKMTSMQHIMILHVCSTDESKQEYLIVEKNSSQYCSTDEDESKSIIVDESSTEESESECVHKNLNKEKRCK